MAKKTAMWQVYGEMADCLSEHRTNEKGTYQHGVEWGIKLALDRISAHIPVEMEDHLKIFKGGNNQEQLVDVADQYEAFDMWYNENFEA